MLSLDDPRWGELRHAFGPAGDAPAWLRAIANDPSLSGHDMSDPFDGMSNFLLNGIIHQGDIYSASYAALPHIVAIIERSWQTCDDALIDVAARIEISRLEERGPSMPPNLADGYFEALAKFRHVAASALGSGSFEDEGRFILWLSALAASNGRGRMAEGMQELAHPDLLLA